MWPLLKNANVRESMFWILALISLLLLSGDISTGSICLWSMIGIDFCPGCGIGRSVGLLLRGDIHASLQAHWLGIPALLAISFRLIQLFNLISQNHKTLNHAG
jgi:hypothetical protein